MGDLPEVDPGRKRVRVFGRAPRGVVPGWDVRGSIDLVCVLLRTNWAKTKQPACTCGPTSPSCADEP